MRKLVVFCFCLASISCYSQTKALFLGNSYTFYNDLPIMVESLASNAGEDLFVDSNTPGGYTLQGHSTNNTSLNKIEEGDWDFVILQEQSQLPSFPEAQFMNDSYPYAVNLNNHILEFNPCAETMFYMTWGRENGDSGNCENWPPVCTYEGMDDLLSERYQLMAEDTEGVVSPVGKVWRYLRENNPELNLYANDGSHPSLLGSYAAAVSFYTCIFRANPTELTENFGVEQGDAEIIRNAVQEVVFNNLEEHLIGVHDITAEFEVEINADESSMTFINFSENADEYVWSINGEEYTSADVEIQLLGGIDNATVVLTSINLCDTVSSEEMVFDFLNSIDELELIDMLIFPNPTKEWLNFEKPVSNVRIYDLSGKLVLDKFDLGSKINLEKLPKGEYSIRYDHESNEFVRVFIKQ